ncbi:MAG: CvpA family protein [Clostridium sp.]|nr:CvpA family protein [Clostridium sp.]
MEIITAYVQEQWLTVAVGVFLAAMVLYGHHRGFLRMIVTAGALILTLTAAHVATPYMCNWLRTNTGVYSAFQDYTLKVIGFGDEEAEQGGPDDDTGRDGVGESAEGDESAEGSAGREGGADNGTSRKAGVNDPSAERTVIEAMPLPEHLKKALIENNNGQVYKILGVDRFADYVAGYLTNSILNILVYLGLFVLVTVAIRLIFWFTSIFSRIPVISGINRTLGAVVGGMIGILCVWIFMLFVMAFSTTELGSVLSAQIDRSEILTWIGEHNLLISMAVRVMKNLIH